MSRINTNVSSLIAQRVLKKNNNSLNTSLERLSTGLKINKGADNPAGLNDNDAALVIADPGIYTRRCKQHNSYSERNLPFLLHRFEGSRP